MIDIHTHILFDSDDGSRTLDETLMILKEAQLLGITDIILTPHYIKDSMYIKNNKEKQKSFSALKKFSKKEGININFFLGNEIYIDNDIHDLIENKEVMTLGDSKYILMELPLFGIINNVREIIFELMLKGYFVIIAHPERNEMFQKNAELISELKSQGVLFQCNMESILGIYGKPAKKSIKKMLKNDQIHFLASDVHHQNTTYKNIEANLKKIKRITKKKFETLTKINPSKILLNEDI